MKSFSPGKALREPIERATIIAIVALVIAGAALIVAVANSKPTMVAHTGKLAG
jgi:hypothetical protein